MKRILTLMSVVILLLAFATAAVAQIAGYNLLWWTADSGGGNSAGGSYSLSGTIGQPDAGTLSGGNYRLEGGFWASGPRGSAQLKVYMPLVRK